MRGTGDTPIIPHLYEQHGERFVERLHGMFALALWDGRRQRLVLARDRVGKKPLLWTRLADGTLAFASELKALVRLPGVSRELDLARLDAFLALQYVPGPGTALRGVHKLPPGHLLVADADGERLERYWEPRPAELRPRRRSGSSASAGRCARRCASGSSPTSRSARSCRAGSTRASSSRRWRSCSRSRCGRSRSASPTPATTSGPRARLVAERYGTVHEEVLLEPDAAELLPRLAAAYDEPFGDSSALPTYLVSEVARRAVTVALVGDGGDEAFAGYERYQAHRARRAARPARPGRPPARRRALAAGAAVRPQRAALAGRAAPRASSTPPAPTRPSATAG